MMSEPTPVKTASRKKAIFRRESVAILLLFLLFVSLRVIHLSADPPDNLSLESCGEYGDPGNYAFNARNKVLFGQWQIDDFAPMYAVPLPHFVTYVFFAVFGVGIWQMNLVPLFFSILCWLGLFLVASRYFPQSRLLFFFLLSLNYPWGIYSRINDQIMPMTFFVILAVYFFLKAWDNPKYFFLSSLSLAFSFMSKEKIIYFHLIVIPLSFLLIVIQRGELLNIRLHLKRIGYFLAGAILAAGPWYFFLFLPHKSMYLNVLAINASAMLFNSPSEAIGNWLHRPAFAFHPANAALTFLLFFYFLSVLFFLFRRNKSEPGGPRPLEIVCSVWLIVGLGLNSFISYRPTRHYIEFSIPLLILSSLFLTRLLATFRLRIRLKKTSLFALSSFLLIWVATTSFSRRLFSRETLFGRPEKVLLVTVCLALVFTALLILAVRFLFSAKDLALPKTAAVLLAAVLLVSYSYQNIKPYAEWATRATYNLKTIGRDLGRAFPEGVFCGLLAPSLSLENRNKAHTSWPDYANQEPDFLKRQKVTHLIVARYNNEPGYYEKNYPGEWKRAKLLARYWIWSSWFLLCEIQKEPALPIRPPFFEAETMERDVGRPLFDPPASNRFAVFVDKGEKGIIGRERVFLPAGIRLGGKLYLKLKESGQAGPFVLLRISRKGVSIYKKSIAARLDDSDNDYRIYDFELSLSEAGNYEFEIQSSGGRGFSFDKIELNTDSRETNRVEKDLP